MEDREGQVPGGHPGHSGHGADHDRCRHRPRASEHDNPCVPRVLQGGGRLLHLRDVQHAPVWGGVPGMWSSCLSPE